jgi:uncharacterized membrane protein YhdT
MSIALLFLVLMILWIVVGFLPQAGKWPNAIGLWLILACLGWAVFGAAIHK